MTTEQMREGFLMMVTLYVGAHPDKDPKDTPELMELICWVNDTFGSMSTAAERLAQSRILHGALDSLIAGFLRANPGKRPSTASVRELMVWSFEQTKRTDEPESTGSRRSE